MTDVMAKDGEPNIRARQPHLTDCVTIVTSFHSKEGVIKRWDMKFTLGNMQASLLCRR